MDIGTNQYCCGCHACYMVCPVQAIRMQSDSEGFIRAYVMKDLCISCGKCCTVCPVLADKIDSSKIQKAYAAVNCDEYTLRRSSSGGVFSPLAQYVLECGGTVYGCAMNENMEATHIRITDAADLDRLRRSKYVQSNIGTTYADVKQDLEMGLKVLYSGTPCQIAGLRLFLKKECKNYAVMSGNLYCVDLICHGVPSPEMFTQNIDFWKEKYSLDIENYEFRLKPDNYKQKYFFFSVARAGG